METYFDDEFGEQNIYKESYVDDLVDNDALDQYEAAFLQGYNE